VARSTAIVKFDSGALGDTIAWIPYVEKYRKVTGFHVIVMCRFQDILKDAYPKLQFEDHDYKLEGIQAGFSISWGSDDRHLKLPLQQVASMTLNLPYKEIKSKVVVPRTPRRVMGKYVCISTHSTSQCKYWNNPDGWETVVRYLLDKGYRVIDIDKHKAMGNLIPLKSGIQYINGIPAEAEDRTGKYPLSDRITDLKYADLFVGLGSGLSWVAHAVGTPVVMIAGYHAQYMGFTENMRFVGAPEGKCSNCQNKYEFARGVDEWDWCPSKKRKEMFECTKYILPETVIQAIEDIL